MLRYPDYTRARLSGLAQRMAEKIYPEKRPVESLLVSTQVGRISYQDAQNLEYRLARRGDVFGPLWSSYWFQGKAVMPEKWQGRRVDLLWVSHSEATLWINGRSIQGLNMGAGDRPDAILTPSAKPGDTIEFSIEMACNKMFGSRFEKPYQSQDAFVLDQCDIALFDPLAWELYHDFMVLQELQTQKELDPAWAGRLLSELNRFANSYDPEDATTWYAAHPILKSLLECRTASYVHELSAIGHAHIDTAWLWPLAETYRKCVRSFSTATAYMDEYSQYRFACSQAAQYEWIKERNPDLYERICAKVKRGQWVPVGGTWVEPDCNIPSGESLVRQFLFGQRFFQQEFGVTCREFWNPDVFGYNGQLPQIMRQSGITRFLTQKLSWNRFNQPLHHTFNWQGIDGSEVLAHFPPADTYNAVAEVWELCKNAHNYKDHDRSQQSLMLFGYGDGGGGPTRRMLEILKRAENLQGLPRTKIRTSEEFFERLENDCTDRPTMVGELYFEYHRGTYTTQAATKKGNRKGELLLHDIEFLAAISHCLGQAEYPHEELNRLWKMLLLNQFHDILPGSSITLVYEDAERDYTEIQRAGERLRQAAKHSFATAMGAGRKTVDQTPAPNAYTPINTTGFVRREVALLPDGTSVLAEAPSYGTGRVIETNDCVAFTASNTGVIFENENLRAHMTKGGELVSLIEKQSEREVLSASANRMELYDDQPTNYDAWDIDPFHLETCQDCPLAHSYEILQSTPLCAEVKFSRAIGEKSRMEQTVRLNAESKYLEFETHVSWHESHKILKVAFPVHVRAMNATYEMQFGYVERPTHYTNSFDLAKYEVSGHRWMDLSEHGFGVALLNDCKYGFSTYDGTMRISLLRAPKDPDPQADMGEHDFLYAIMPHVGGWREAGVVAEGMHFNMPFQWVEAEIRSQSLLSTDDPNLVIDTVKKAEDSDALIVRLYECHGARGRTTLRCSLPFSTAEYCNLLEEETSEITIERGLIRIDYMPLQLMTIKLKFGETVKSTKR